jgi:DNA-binding LacI/PurR family transcriptional regulator
VETHLQVVFQTVSNVVQANPSVKQEIGFQASSKDLKILEVAKLVNFVPTDFVSKTAREPTTVIVVNLALEALVSRIV